jgi:hypothetical protein
MQRRFRMIRILIGLLLAFGALHAQSVTKYSYLPKKVYENQVFPVTVIVMGAKEQEKLDFKFDSKRGIQPLFEKPLVIKNGDDRFYTFYFKAKDQDIWIPALTITSKSNETVLLSSHIPLENLQANDQFSGVIAADLKVRNAQVSNYDEKSHIATLNIEANEANLEDMKLLHVQESGIEDIERNFAKVSGDLYAVLPLEQKELQFTYFNTIQNEYNTIKLPIEVKDASLVTHSDLNPKEDSFDKLKKFSLIFFSAFFLLMFVFKRDFFYLVLGAVSFITLLTLFIPHKKVCIKQGAPLYILPTKTSTVSTYIDQKFETMLLGERKPYLKIEYKKGIVGWVKDEDLCEN